MIPDVAHGLFAGSCRNPRDKYSNGLGSGDPCDFADKSNRTPDNQGRDCATNNIFWVDVSPAAGLHDLDQLMNEIPQLDRHGGVLHERTHKTVTGLPGHESENLGADFENLDPDNTAGRAMGLREQSENSDNRKKYFSHPKSN